MPEVIHEAGEALLQAENKLRRMMETALSQQRYGDVAKLAPLADALLNMIGTASRDGAVRTRPSDSADKDAGQKANGESQSHSAVPSFSRPTVTGYPRFERQGDRLVKLAWSKKDHREYEHRAPANVVFRVAELFEDHCATGTQFLMDALMPFKTRKGQDIPSYQAYLALAWFRSLGIVESRGKDGYAVAVSQLRQKAKDAWSHLPDTLRR